MLKRFIKIFVWTIVGLYTAIVILLHIPFVQSSVGEWASRALSEKFGTKVTVGRVDLGFINRLIIDDSKMLDQQGKQMLNVARISVKISLSAIAHGQIEITSAQFFGLHANLYKATPEAKPNFQFVIDSLASKDTTKQSAPLDLKINSLIIRNSSVAFRVLSKPSLPDVFSTNDINVRDLSAHFIVNRITNDSLNVKVKRLSLKERCGFELKKLAFNACISRNGASLDHLQMELPSSQIAIDHIGATYSMSDGKPDRSTLRFNGSIDIKRLTPRDMACFLPKLRNANLPLAAHANFSGTGYSLNASNISISSFDRSLSLRASASVEKHRHLAWRADIKELKIGKSAAALAYQTATGKQVPAALSRLGDIVLHAKGHGMGGDASLSASLSTAIGSVKMEAARRNTLASAHIETRNLNIGQLLEGKNVGALSATIDAKGKAKDDVAVKGDIYDINYNGYTYRNIKLSASYLKKVIDGKLSIDDPNARINVSALLDTRGRLPHLKMDALVKSLSPSALNLTHKWNGASFAADINCDIKGNNINNADGELRVNGFTMQEKDSVYSIDNIHVVTGYEAGNHFLNLRSDFGSIDLSGHFSYNTIARSVLNQIASKLPTVPGLVHKPQSDYNDFTINATLHDTKWMERLLGVPLELHSTLNLSGEIDDRGSDIDLWCDVPEFSYNGARYKDTFVNIESPGDTLKADIRVKKVMAKGKALSIKLNAGAHNNHLNTSLTFNNNERHPLMGVINASTVFAKSASGASTAYVDVLESSATIGDTIWHVSPSRIVYSKNHLDVDGFRVSHGEQFIAVDGTATTDHADSLAISLNDVNVSYVLNLVNFHSVDFFGKASGKAFVAGAFSKQPKMAANLEVKDFMFETGHMGTLFADVAYDDEQGRINIDAVAKDGADRNTVINGYVSPRHNFIDLAIDAQNTRAEFMEGFCDSFMDNIDASINGNVNVVGPLSNINLVGKAKVDGSVHMSALNTTYWLRGDSVTFVPDEIKFERDTLYDRNGNIGILNGSIFHKHLTNMSYDLEVQAKNLLSYDTHDFDGSSFYGTAYTTGTCDIKGRSGEVNIDIKATPNRNSILVYNVADRNSIASQDYIQWKTHDADSLLDADNADRKPTPIKIGTNIHINFLVNCNPDATLKILMDEKTGDYIRLNGDGVLRATYFNKGTFDLYGNYTVDEGLYKLTIQNIIKKDFEFQRGGTISFGGDPYNASLDLSALYVLNSVSLADLNIGRSFSNNNVRVNCLMNITGTPESPKVSFSLDMPTLSNDAKQMVYSLLNAEEETNQQVLYLLAVGRFYAPSDYAGSNSTQQYSQTSLAMQSILSGTISQQINELLSNVINSSNWNFGANISTGTDGFYNAEYEGILSGKLLNNRLLINGQFGYRDNPNTTNNFIGDFDLKYLLFPNGNLAINLYNKTNDRYFTRNSLNTQGLGLIMKTDFTRISDLFFWRKKEKKEK